MTYCGPLTVPTLAQHSPSVREAYQLTLTSTTTSLAASVVPDN
jgi:hypothetical protein